MTLTLTFALKIAFLDFVAAGRIFSVSQTRLDFSDFVTAGAVSNISCFPFVLKFISYELFSLQFDKDYCMLLALPCGRDHDDIINQTRAMASGFIQYLQQKQAAGIVNVPEPETLQVKSFVMPPNRYCKTLFYAPGMFWACWYYTIICQKVNI